MRKTLLAGFLLPSILITEAQTVVTVDMNKIEGAIPSYIYGAGAEDVNHEIYGGLYDQRIFGESFEEPAVMQVKGFSQYDTPWTLKDGILSVETSGNGKIVYDAKKLEKGSVSVDMRIDSPDAISGFIFNVSEPGNGADSFRGYEISLNGAKQVLVIGKHNHDWQPIAEVPFSFKPGKWNKFQVDFDGAKAKIKVNGKHVYDFEDKVDPLTSGFVGLRSFNGSADFRNFKIDDKLVALESQGTGGVSGMWLPVGSGKYSLVGEGAFNGDYAQSITGKAGDGVCNKGLNKWGIGIEKEVPMFGYVYLRGNVPGAFVALQNADGSREYCRQELDGITDEWQRFNFTLIPDSTDNNARFVIALGEKGSMFADMAMLHTADYPYRADITNAFRDENLTFLRYGGTMVNAKEYMTKNMVGPRDLRQPYIGHWYRNSTNGFGIEEFVRFARQIGTEPTFSINIEDNPEDVLRLLKEIEDCNLRYIEIGNEENISDDSRDAYEHYVDRFLTLYNAIHPVYPDLQFINAAWWRADKPELMEYVFRKLDGKSPLWDYHPWTDEVSQAVSAEKDLAAIRNMFHQWNPETDMHLALLEENGNTHSMHRALSHAYMLNVVRRMNGFIELDSPANALQPYRQNDNGWDQGQIFFNSSDVWCQPPYYAQQMAASHHQPILVSTSFEDPELDITSTRSIDGKTLVVHIVNPTPNEKEIAIKPVGLPTIDTVKGISLSGELNGENTPEEPEKIIPRDLRLTSTTATIAPYSYTIIEIGGE